MIITQDYTCRAPTAEANAKKQQMDLLLDQKEQQIQHNLLI